MVLQLLFLQQKTEEDLVLLLPQFKVGGGGMLTHNLCLEVGSGLGYRDMGRYLRLGPVLPSCAG